MSEQRTTTAVKLCILYVAFFVFILVRTAGRADAAESGRRYDPLIAELAEEHEVDPALVKAVIRAESAFDRKAVSRAGARGLMQLMPRIARHHGVSDPNDPRQNIRAGVRLLRDLLDRFDNDFRLALAAYNAGGEAVTRFRGLPPYRETRQFVSNVLRLRERYSRETLVTTDGWEDDEVSKEEPVLAAREVWPRRAETIWFGAGRNFDGSALRAAMHSPEKRLGDETRPHSSVP